MWTRSSFQAPEPVKLEAIDPHHAPSQSLARERRDTCVVGISVLPFLTPSRPKHWRNLRNLRNERGESVIRR